MSNNPFPNEVVFFLTPEEFEILKFRLEWLDGDEGGDGYLLPMVCYTKGEKPGVAVEELAKIRGVSIEDMIPCDPKQFFGS